MKLIACFVVIVFRRCRQASTGLYVHSERGRLCLSERKRWIPNIRAVGLSAQSVRKHSTLTRFSQMESPMGAPTAEAKPETIADRYIKKLRKIRSSGF